MKKGLIMEGGAMRGLFTAGVIDVLMENEIEFDGAVGVSAGAVFGCNYKSRQIGRPVRYNKRFCKDPRYGSFKSLIKTGDVFEAKFCYETIPNELDIFDVATYEENPMEFYVTCTDVETGKPVYHKCMKGDAEDVQWMRASASMPLVSNIVEIDGQKLLDGGISDSIPVKFFEEEGFDRNVVILTRSDAYVKKKAGYLPLAKVMLHKYPEFVKTIANRHNDYNGTVEYIREKEKAGELFVIRPPQELGISQRESDPEELERVYQMGRAEATKRLEALKAYLAE